MPDVGTGATITFGTSSFTHNAIKIGGFDEEREVVPTTHLGTSARATCMPGDLVTPGDFEVEYQWDCLVQAPATAAVETVTITYPIPSGKTNAATHAGTAFISKRTSPDLEVDALMVGGYTVKWSGTTGPAFTAAT